MTVLGDYSAYSCLFIFYDLHQNLTVLEKLLFIDFLIE